MLAGWLAGWLHKLGEIPTTRQQDYKRYATGPEELVLNGGTKRKPETKNDKLSGLIGERGSKAYI